MPAHQEQLDGYVGVVAKWVHLFWNRRRFGVGVGRLRPSVRSAFRGHGAARPRNARLASWRSGT